MQSDGFVDGDGDIQGEGLITDFVYGLGDRTKVQYIRNLAIFFDFIHITRGPIEKQAAQFLKEFKDRGGTRNGREWAQGCLMRFIGYLNEKVNEGKFGRGTLRNYYKAVKRFCDSQDIELGWKRITRGLGKVRRVAHDRAPTLEEIQRLVEYPDRRIKPIVYTMASSGIRIGAWEYLKWKHIKPLDRDGQPVDKDMSGSGETLQIAAAKISVYGGQEEEYFSFITPEAFNALKDWMAFRKAAGEDISSESPLMRDIFPFKYGKSTAQNPRRLLTESVWKIIESGLKEQGIRQPLTNGARRYEFQGAHGFRKYFKTRAEQAGMRPFNVETLMDHSLGISDHYGRPTEYDLFIDYLKAVDCLTIGNGNGNKSIKQVSEHQRVLEAQMQSKDRELQTLKDEMESQNQIFTDKIAKLEESIANHIALMNNPGLITRNGRFIGAEVWNAAIDDTKKKQAANTANARVS